MNLLLVLGAYKGDAIDAFFDAKKIDNTWEIVCYEPNQDTISIIQNKYPQALIHNKAVLDNSGFIDFKLSKNEQNSGVSENIENIEKSYLVESIDIDTILDTLESYEQIILRIDIEGSEYQIIDKLIKHKNIKKIKELYLEWHTKGKDVDLDPFNKELIKNIPLTLIAFNDGKEQFKMLTTHSS